MFMNLRVVARLWALTFVASALLQQSAFAELLVYEGFDFAGPGIVGQGSGFGWNENEEDAPVGWINSSENFTLITDDGVSLDSPAFAFAPTGNRVQAEPTESGGSRTAARSLKMGDWFSMQQDGAELFMSFLIRRDSSINISSNNLEVGLYADGTVVTRFGITSNDQFFLTMAGQAAQGHISDDFVNYGETYFVVVKTVTSADDILGAAGTDQAFAAIYDSTSQPPTTEPIEWDLNASWGKPQTINRVRMEAGINAWGSIDEIRVGTTFASVVDPDFVPPVSDGDFDGDGIIDGHDFLTWQRGFGSTYDASDLTAWEASFGNPGGGISTVPEPSSLLLLVCASLAASLRRRIV